MSTHFTASLLFAAAAATAGCASNTAASTETHAVDGDMHGKMAGMMSKDPCPMAINDVVVSAQDTDEHDAAVDAGTSAIIPSCFIAISPPCALAWW